MKTEPFKYAKIAHAVLHFDSVFGDYGPASMITLQKVLIMHLSGAPTWEVVAFLKRRLQEANEECREKHNPTEAQVYFRSLVAEEMDDPLFERYMDEKIEGFKEVLR